MPWQLQRVLQRVLHLVEEQVWDHSRPSFGCCGSPALPERPILVHAPGADSGSWQHRQAMQAPKCQVAGMSECCVLRCTIADASGGLSAAAGELVVGVAPGIMAGHASPSHCHCRLASICRLPSCRCPCTAFCAAHCRLLQCSVTRLLGTTICPCLIHALQLSGPLLPKRSDVPDVHCYKVNSHFQRPLNLASCWTYTSTKSCSVLKSEAELASRGLSTSMAGPVPSWPKWLAPHIQVLPSSSTHPAAATTCFDSLCCASRPYHTVELG